MPILSNLFRISWALLIIILIYPSAYCDQNKQLEDVVYLKDGSIIRGTIIEQVPGESLKIETTGGNVFVFSMKKIERIAKEPSKSRSRLGRKNGGTAFVLSLLVPGGGQFYNGESGKGIAMLSTCVLGVILLSSSGSSSDSYYQTTEPGGLAGFGVLLMLGGSLWSIIDAPISSARINQENTLASGFRITDKVYVDVGILEFNSQETSFIKAVVLF